MIGNAKVMAVFYQDEIAKFGKSLHSNTIAPQGIFIAT
jgi:hypothetical protein